MSPKYSSLAFDIKEDQELDTEFAPELTLLVKERNRSESDLSFEIPTRISGSVTVSF